MASKSPFLVIQNFISNQLCDEIADKARVEPLLGDDGQAQAIERHFIEGEDLIFDQLQPIIPQIEEHFTGFDYRGTEHMVFQQFPVTNGRLAEEPHCENAVFKRKKWVKVKDRDLTGLLWLKDFQDAPPFNPKRQVLGGKLEFPVYNFGFQPQKGTLVIYPACERFISLTSPVLVGELQCVRIHMCSKGMYLYDPQNYPGDFRTWFEDIV